MAVSESVLVASANTVISAENDSLAKPWSTLASLGSSSSRSVFYKMGVTASDITHLELFEAHTFPIGTRPPIH